MNTKNIIVIDDVQALYVHAAEEIAHFAGEAVCTHGEFTFCLSGGSTPEQVFTLLGTRFHLSVDWKEVQFFWGDERCVPPTHEASNFNMASRALLSKVDLRAEQIHRIRGEDPPAEGARKYEEELRRCFMLGNGELPRFSVALLGIGENAHTASLFPGDPVIHESERMAVAVEVDAPQRYRVTLTPPVFNNAARVMFIASGAGKAQAVKNIIDGPRDVDRFPAQAIAPTDGELIWLLDKAAASLLS